MPSFRFYAVAEYATGSPQEADALADRLVAAGCDDLLADHPQNTVQVAYGPFLSTAKSLPELAADARAALVRIAGRGTGMPTVLNATSDSSGTVHDLTPIASPGRTA